MENARCIEAETEGFASSLQMRYQSTQRLTTLKTILARLDVRALILILSASAVLAFGYFSRVDVPNYGFRIELHNQIIAGTAPAPYRYRILVPVIAELCDRGLSALIPAKAAFLAAYGIYDFLSIAFLLLSLFYWLRVWFTREQTLIGCLFVAATVPIAFQPDQYFQPWSILESGLFSAALFAMHKRRYWLLWVIVALASLNRETALLIPLAFLLTTQWSNNSNEENTSWRKPVLILFGLLLTSGAELVGVHLLRGSSVQVITVRELMRTNLTPRELQRTLVNWSLFLGGFWTFASLGFSRAPKFLRRVAWVIPPYLLAIAIWGVWHEVRLLMVLYPILIPLGLLHLYPQNQRVHT